MEFGARSSFGLEAVVAEISVAMRVRRCVKHGFAFDALPDLCHQVAVELLLLVDEDFHAELGCSVGARADHERDFFDGVLGSLFRRHGCSLGVVAGLG